MIERNLSTQTYQNCYVLPYKHVKTPDGLDVSIGGLYCNGSWIKESALFPSALAASDFDEEEFEYIDEEVVFIGYMSDVWGHAITDCLKHLWWLRTDEYKEKHIGKKLIYWGPKTLSGNFLELVRLAGVDISKLYYIDRKIRYRSVIVPDLSFNYTEGWATKEYLDTIDLIVSNVKTYERKERKVFLSERETRRIYGIKTIEKVARSAGYTVYYPGEHSLQDQISVIRSASHILSFESSVGHNTIFCNSKTKVIMIRKADYPNVYQQIINELRNLDCTTVNSSLSVMNDERYPYGGPFFVYPNELLCNLLMQTCDKKSKLLNSFRILFPFKEFRDYIGYSSWCNEGLLAIRLLAKEEQLKVLAHEIVRYRESQIKKLNGLLKFVPLPSNLKERIVTKIAKYKVRRLV